MNIYSNINDIEQAVLVVGDAVRILGERTEGDIATMTGRVRQVGDPINNRVVFSKNGLPIEIFPVPATEATKEFVEGEIHDFHTDNVKGEWQPNQKITSWVHKIFQEDEYRIPKTIPFITAATWELDKDNWIILDSNIKRLIGTFFNNQHNQTLNTKVNVHLGDQVDAGATFAFEEGVYTNFGATRQLTSAPTLQENFITQSIKRIGISVEEYGIKVNDASPEQMKKNSDIMDVILAHAPRTGTGFYTSIGNLLFDSLGVYSFERNWELKTQVNIIGCSNGFQGGQCCELSFSGADYAAIVVNRYNTLNNGIEATGTTAADGSTITGVKITARARHEGCQGVWFRARAKIQDSYITGFGGWGMYIVADAVSSDAQHQGNANLWQIERLTLQFNGTLGKLAGGGLYTRGGDANAGFAIGINAVDNYGRGICDDSFLGNSYMNCHTATNHAAGQVSHNGNRYYLRSLSESAGGANEPDPVLRQDIWTYIGAGGIHSFYPAWVSGNNYAPSFGYQSLGLNARNVFTGCYNEGGEPPALLNSPAVVVGGILTGGGAGMTHDSTALTMAGGGRISQHFTQMTDGLSRIQFGGKLADPIGIGLYRHGDHTDGITLQMDTQGWVWKWGNATSGSDHRMLSSDNTLNNGRSAHYRGGTETFSGMGLGQGGSMRYFGRATWTTGTNFPSSGEYAKGDTFLFSGANAGGFIGCICTTAGIAGSTAVFKNFGQIQA